jgi:hypothetical protein
MKTIHMQHDSTFPSHPRLHHANLLRPAFRDSEYTLCRRVVILTVNVLRLSGLLLRSFHAEATHGLPCTLPNSHSFFGSFLTSDTNTLQYFPRRSFWDIKSYASALCPRYIGYRPGILWPGFLDTGVIGYLRGPVCSEWHAGMLMKSSLSFIPNMEISFGLVRHKVLKDYALSLKHCNRT